jgi:hypothetical protein
MDMLENIKNGDMKELESLAKEFTGKTPTKEEVISVAKKLGINVENLARNIKKVMTEKKIKTPKPNEPCFCGSGKKFKKCCRPE